MSQRVSNAEANYEKMKSVNEELVKENTELKVENQLLREKISKLDANKEPAENKSQAGLKSLRNIYDSGYIFFLFGY